MRFFKKKEQPPTQQKWAEPYLIQRLKKPYEDNGNQLTKIAESFSFGGGLVRGGFSDKAWNIIKKMFSFDYMGSAEFEWGAVPEAFHAIAIKRKDFVSFSKVYKGSPYKTYIIPEGKARRKVIDMPARTATVYVLCHRDIKDQVDDFLDRLRQGDYGNNGIRLKEGTRFLQCLFPEETDSWKSMVLRKENPNDFFITYKDVKGWIDLGNHFMFFTDKDMFDATKALFQIQ